MISKYFRVSRSHVSEASSDDFIVLFPIEVGYNEMVPFYGIESIVSAGLVNVNTESKEMNYCYGVESTSIIGKVSLYDDTRLFKNQYGIN